MSVLRELLEDAADRAKVYDVTQQAWTGAVRRRRLRFAAGSATAAAIVGAVVVGLTVNGTAVPPGPAPLAHKSATPAPSPSGPPTVTACTVQKLEMPGGYPESSSLTAGDPSGRFHGGRAYPTDNRDRLLVWDNGKVNTLPAMGNDSEIVDVSRNGTLLITGLIGHRTQTWVYHDGQMIGLKGTNVTGHAINDRGVVIGARGDSVGGEAVVWRTFTAEPEPLPLPGPSWTAIVRNINNSGHIIGHGGPGGPDSWTHMLLWSPDGKLIGTFSPSQQPGWLNIPIAIFDETAYVRSASMTAAASEYWRVDLRTGLTAKLPWTDPHISRVAANGLLLSEISRTAAIVSGSVRVNLPDVPGHQHNQPGVYEISMVTAMSEDGRTLGGYQSMSLPSAPTNIAAGLWRCQ